MRSELGLREGMEIEAHVVTLFGVTLREEASPSAVRCVNPRLHPQTGRGSIITIYVHI
jgi:hypothetical protein